MRVCKVEIGGRGYMHTYKVPRTALSDCPELAPWGLKVHV